MLVHNGLMVISQFCLLTLSVLGGGGHARAIPSNMFLERDQVHLFPRLTHGMGHQPYPWEAVTPNHVSVAVPSHLVP